jgi:hypothetical protein
VSKFWKRIGSSVVFGASAAYASLQVSGLPKDKNGWLGVGAVFVMAAYGKYSSSQTFLAPDRPVWTETQRKVDQLASINDK